MINWGFDSEDERKRRERRAMLELLMLDEEGGPTTDPGLIADSMMGPFKPKARPVTDAAPYPTDLPNLGVTKGRVPQIPDEDELYHSPPEPTPTRRLQPAPDSPYVSPRAAPAAGPYVTPGRKLGPLAPLGEPKDEEDDVPQDTPRVAQPEMNREMLPYNAIVAPTLQTERLQKAMDDRNRFVSGTANLSVIQTSDGFALLDATKPDGTKRTFEELQAEYERTGQHLGIYDSNEAAGRAAQQIFQEIEKDSEEESVRQTGSSAPYGHAGENPRDETSKHTVGNEYDTLSSEEWETERGNMARQTIADVMAPKDPASTLQRISPADSKGPNPDPYGYDTDTGFARDDRIQQAQELYRDAEPSTRYEQEFRATHSRLTDEDMKHRMMLGGLSAGLLGGRGMNINALQQQLRNEQMMYDKGLQEARERDLAETQIDRGLAEAIASSGVMSPQQAVRLKYGSQVVRDFATVVAQGGAAEQRDLVRDTSMVDALGRQNISDQRNRSDMAERLISQETLLKQLAAVQGSKAPLSPEQSQATLASYYHIAFGLPDDVAQQAAAGDLSNVPEHIRGDVKATGTMWATTANDPAGRRQIVAGMMAAIGKGPINTTNKLRDKQTLAPDMADAVKDRMSVREQYEALKVAKEAWRNMSDDARAAFVQLGKKTPDFIKDLYGREEFQAEAADLEALSAALLRLNAGLSQTSEEMRNQMRTQGITADWWNPVADPKAFARFLERHENALKSRARWMKKDGRWDRATTLMQQGYR